MNSSEGTDRDRRQRLSRTVWALGMVSLLTDMASDMVYPVLPVFLVGTLGASALTLGLIEGVAEAAAAVFKLLSGHLSDRSGRRKPWVTAGYALSGLTKPLLALAATPLHVLAIRFSDRTGKGIRSAPRDALLAAHATSGNRGRVFGFHRGLDTLGAVLGPLVAALVLLVSPEGYRLLFALTVVPGLIAVMILVIAVRERAEGPRAPGRADSEVEAETEPSGEKPESSSPSLWPVLAIVFVFSLGNSSEAFLLLRAQGLGVAVVLLPILWLVMNVVYATTSFWAGPWSDRVGRRTVVALGLGLYAVTYVLLGAGVTGLWLWLAFAVYGLYFGMTDGVLRAAVADRVRARGRGTAYGVYHALTGVTLLFASVLAGWLWDVVSPAAPFYLGAASATLAALMTLLLLRPVAISAVSSPRG